MMKFLLTIICIVCLLSVFGQTSTCIVCSLSVFGQTSTTLKVFIPGRTMKDGKSVWDIPNWRTATTSNTKNCFEFLEITVYERSKNDGQILEYKVEVTNNSPFMVGVTCSRWSFGTYGSEGRNSRIVPGATHGEHSAFQLEENNKTIVISKVNFTFNESERKQYGKVISEYLNCEETAASYIAKLEKENLRKNEIAALKAKIKTLSHSPEDLVQKKSIYNSLNELEGNNKYASQINDVNKQLESLKVKEENITSIKSQLSNLPDTEEGLIRKKNLLQQLAQIENNSYSDEINQVDDKLAMLQKANGNKQQNQNTSDNDDFWGEGSSKTNSDSAQTQSVSRQPNLDTGQSLPRKKSAQEIQQEQRQAAYDAQMAKIKQQEDYYALLDQQRNEAMAKFDNAANGDKLASGISKVTYGAATTYLTGNVDGESLVRGGVDIAAHLLKKSAEKKEREAETLRIQAEQRRIEAERHAFIKKLATSRNTSLSAIDQFSYPKSSIDLKIKGGYFFCIYMHQNATEELNPVIGLSKIFTIDRYSDGTWPFENTIKRKLAGYHASPIKLAGYFSSFDEAFNQLSSINKTFAETGATISIIDVSDQFKSELNNNKTRGQSDFWGNTKQATDNKDTTVKSNSNAGFWND